MPQNIQQLNAILKSNSFRSNWPQCSGKVNLSKTYLFDAAYFTTEAKELLKMNKYFSKDSKLELKNHVQKKSLIRNVISVDK